MRTKQQILDNLVKNYRTGDYWLVNFGNGWYLACQEPKYPERFISIERYHLDTSSCIIGSLAQVTKVN